MQMTHKLHFKVEKKHNISNVSQKAAAITVTFDRGLADEKKVRTFLRRSSN